MANKIVLIGFKEGICPLCDKEKNLILIREGITACEDCLAKMKNILKFCIEPKGFIPPSTSTE